MEADGFIKIWQAFNGIQLMIEIYDCLWLLSFLDIINYWFVIAPHKYQHVGGKEIQHILWSESPKPLFLFVAQHISKYIFSYMDHNDDFQDMVSVLFKSRQGANVTVISHANYTWNHRVSFYWCCDLIKKRDWKMWLKTDCMKTCLRCTRGVFLQLAASNSNSVRNQSDPQTGWNSASQHSECTMQVKR